MLCSSKIADNSDNLEVNDSAQARLALQQLNQQSEEQLLNNPKLQKMMEKFFVENFKMLQGNLNREQKDGSNPSGKGRDKDSGGFKTVVNQNQVLKSPSDTTIYTPALQKKLMPEQEGRV